MHIRITKKKKHQCLDSTPDHLNQNPWKAGPLGISVKLSAETNGQPGTWAPDAGLGSPPALCIPSVACLLLWLHPLPSLPGPSGITHCAQVSPTSRTVKYSPAHLRPPPLHRSNFLKGAASTSDSPLPGLSALGNYWDILVPQGHHTTL